MRRRVPLRLALVVLAVVIAGTALALVAHGRIGDAAGFLLGLVIGLIFVAVPALLAWRFRTRRRSREDATAGGRS